MVLLGQVVPNFQADSTVGKIDFHDFIAEDADKWVILFSHPADFTPTCTTELAGFQKVATELKKRNVKPIALSCNTVSSHKAWERDIVAYGCLDTFTIPIVADPDKRIAVEYGMLDPDEKDAAGLPLTCRAVFIIGPDKRLKLSILYPATTGRNTDEVLRVIDSLQLTASKKVATPVNWKPGQDVIVPANVSKQEVDKHFPEGSVKTLELPSGKPYLRIAKAPTTSE